MRGKGPLVAELTSKTIAELRDGFRSGEFSAREIAEAYNAAVAAARVLNAYTVETPDDALAAADAADRARSSGELGTLAGSPLGIRDLFATDGDCRDAVLANAPEAQHGFFAVPKVIE